MSSSASPSTPENGSTERPSSRAAASVASDVATQRTDKPLRASAGRRNATVEPVPSPTRMPSSTTSAAASAASCFSRPLLTQEILPVGEVADARDRDIRRRMRREQVGVVGELTGSREHRRHALAPVQLRGGEDPHLVVHEDVAVGGEAALDVVELLLFAHVDKERVRHLADARPGDLGRLEDGVPVGEDDGRPEITQASQYLERAGIETIRERVPKEVPGHGEEPGIPAVGLPPLLHGAEIVAIAELDEAALLDRPVGIPPIRPVLRFEVSLEVVPEAVVVEQGVVDVDEEGSARRAHRDILS